MKNLILSILLLPTFSWAADSLPVKLSLTCDASYVTRTDEPGSRRYHAVTFSFRSPTAEGNRNELEFTSTDNSGSPYIAKGTPLVMPDDWGVGSDGSPYLGKIVFDGKIVKSKYEEGTTFKLVLRGPKLLELLGGSIEELSINSEDESNIWNYLSHGEAEAAVIQSSSHGYRYDEKNNRYNTRRLGYCYGWVKRVPSKQ